MAVESENQGYYNQDGYDYQGDGENQYDDYYEEYEEEQNDHHGNGRRGTHYQNNKYSSYQDHQAENQRHPNLDPFQMMQAIQNMQTWAQIFNNKNFSIANLNTYTQPSEQPKEHGKLESKQQRNIDIHKLIDEDNTVKSMMPKNLRSSPPGTTPIYSLENSDKKEQKEQLTETELQRESTVVEQVFKIAEETAKTTAESKEINFLGDTVAH